MLTRFVRKPQPDDQFTAIKWTGSNCVEVFDFIGLEHEPHDDEIDEIHVPTSRRLAVATSGDWVIRYDSGEFGVIDPDDFDEQYEALCGRCNGTRKVDAGEDGIGEVLIPCDACCCYVCSDYTGGGVCDADKGAA